MLLRQLVVAHSRAWLAAAVWSCVYVWWGGRGGTVAGGDLSHQQMLPAFPFFSLVWCRKSPSQLPPESCQEQWIQSGGSPVFSSSSPSLPGATGLRITWFFRDPRRAKCGTLYRTRETTTYVVVRGRVQFKCRSASVSRALHFTVKGIAGAFHSALCTMHQSNLLSPSSTDEWRLGTG